MNQKASLNIKQTHYLSFWILVFILISVPLAITTLLYNQADLPKSSMLIFSGGVFVFAVLLSVLFKGSSDAGFNLHLNRSIDTYVLGLLLAAVLSTVFSLNPYISFWGQYQRQVGLNLFIYLTLIYFAASTVLKDRKSISAVLLAMEITAAVIAVYAILQELGADPFGIQQLNVKRPVSTLGNSVFLGGLLVIVLPLSVLNASRKKNIVLKYLMPLIILSGIIVSRTRSAYIALAVQAVFFLFLFRYSGLSAGKKNTELHFRLLLISGVALILLVVLVIAFPDNRYSSRIISIFGEGSNPRWLLWRDSFSIFLKYPLFGPGIGMFPNAFEEFYSYQLRYTDTMRYFDHAHNNFLHALYTMGIAGFTAYVIFLFSLFKSSFDGLSLTYGGENERKLSFSLFLVLAGYSAYGLTNFDDIAILLYVFVIAAIIKALRKDSIPIALNQKMKIPAFIFAFVMLLYLGFNIWNSYMNIIADIHFLKGVKGFSGQKFREGAEETNEAIFANGNCSMYRYILAFNVYKYVSSGARLDEAGKKSLLEQALAETNRAEKNFINKNECDALRSLILFELGKVEEADKLKDVVLARNSINQDYRVSLAYYFFNSGDTTAADEQLKIVLDIIPGNVNALNAAAFFSFRRGEMDKARFYCDKILEIDPGNRSAAELMKFIK